MSEEPLFEVTPLPHLEPGDTVTVQTMWGTERATVRRVHDDEDGYPMVTVDAVLGDTYTISVARVTRAG